MGRLYLAFALALAASASSVAAQSTSTSPPWPYQTFVSEPTFLPPIIEVNKTGETANGHIVFALNGDVGPEEAGLIMTEDGKLLWQTEAAVGGVSNLTPTKLFGKDVLTYWTGESLSATGDSYGAITIIDDSYNFLYNVTLSDPELYLHGEYPSLIDSHEAFITPDNTLLVVSYNATPWDLSPVGGPEEGWLRDGVVYEIDIVSNEILFKWKASTAIPITASHCPLGQDSRSGYGNSSGSSWDYVHLNAVCSFEDGFLVSSRHTFEGLYVDKNTGEIAWSIQGETGGNFTMDPEATFRWQHDIRLHNLGGEVVMSLHDNDNNYTAPYNATTGNLIALDLAAKTATARGIYRDPSEQVQSSSGGAVQLLGNGNVWMNYGSQPVVKEYTAPHEVALTFRFGPPNSPTNPGVGAYRAFKWEWKGYPTTKPAASACRNVGGGVDVYMSWNGATELDSWNVYAGNTACALKLTASDVARKNFETSTTVTAADFVQVEALGGCRNKTETRRSAVIVVRDSC